MAVATICISEASQTILKELAERTGQTTSEILEKAIDTYRRKMLLEQLNAGYAKLRSDPAALAEYLEEHKLWESTLMDGLDDDEKWTDDGH